MRHAVLGTVLLLALPGCSSSSSANSASSDAGADAPSAPVVDPAANWSCLGKVKADAPVAASIPFDFGLADPLNNKPVPGLTVKTCDRADTGCTTPHETLTTNENGNASFTSLPLGTSGFDGYFEVRSGDGLANLNFQPPVTRAIPGYTRLYWGDSQLATALSAGGLQVDLKNLGSIGWQAHDCSEYPGGVSCVGSQGCASYHPGGVVSEIDVKDPRIVHGVIVYENGTVTVSTTRTSTSALVGSFAYFNVPPGPVTLTLRVEATGQVIGTYKLFARAGAFSAIVAPPQ